MKDKVGKCESLSGLYLFYYCDKYRSKLFGFLMDRGESSVGEYLDVLDKFQPVDSFFEFLQRSLDFAYEVRVGLGVLSFSIMRPNRCAGANQLLADDLSFDRVGKSGV